MPLCQYFFGIGCLFCPPGGSGVFENQRFDRHPKGNPKTIRFAQRERSFCGDCGTPLMFFDPAIPHLFEVSTCSLDEPDRFPPEDQCWLMDALVWSDPVDALPRYDEYSPLPE